MSAEQTSRSPLFAALTCLSQLFQGVLLKWIFDKQINIKMNSFIFAHIIYCLRHVGKKLNIVTTDIFKGGQLETCDSS